MVPGNSTHLKNEIIKDSMTILIALADYKVSYSFAHNSN